jgi:hypothetical protein
VQIVTASGIEAIGQAPKAVIAQALIERIARAFD